MTISGAILADVARQHGLTVQQMLTGGASHRYAWPKQEAMWRLRQLRWVHTGARRFSFCQIADIVGVKDHTTAIHGARAHARRRRSPAVTCGRGKWREQRA